jgi:hypothetical protein
VVAVEQALAEQVGVCGVRAVEVPASEDDWVEVVFLRLLLEGLLGVEGGSGRAVGVRVGGLVKSFAVGLSSDPGDALKDKTVDRICFDGGNEVFRAVEADSVVAFPGLFAGGSIDRDLRCGVHDDVGILDRLS